MKSSNEQRKVRHLRIRKKIMGTEERPRLVVYKSNMNFYSQLINDDKNIILASSSTKSLKLPNKNKESVLKVAKDLATKISKLNIKEVVFDRGGYLYHGKISAFCDEIRKSGVKF